MQMQITTTRQDKTQAHRYKDIETMNPLARHDTLVCIIQDARVESVASKRGQQIDTTRPFQVPSFAEIACKLTRHKLKRHVMQ